MSRIIAREAPMTTTNKCSSCIREGVWRCKDCLGLGTYCTDCFRERHRLLPFHRVEHWSGDHFGAAWLCQAGVVIQLGHSGGCCPAQGHTPNDSQPNADDEDDDELDNVGMDESDDDWEDEDISFPAVNEQSVLPDLKGKDVVIVIDVSGVHKIRILPCRCPNALTLEHQYLEMGFFPTSFLVIKSVVTFSTLEDQRLDNLECKTAVLKYWNKVRRKTAPVDWNKLPVSHHTCHWLFILVFIGCLHRTDIGNSCESQGCGEIFKILFNLGSDIIQGRCNPAN